jgi:hypothetical protein
VRRERAARLVIVGEGPGGTVCWRSRARSMSPRTSRRVRRKPMVVPAPRRGSSCCRRAGRFACALIEALACGAPVVATVCPGGSRRFSKVGGAADSPVGDGGAGGAIRTFDRPRCRCCGIERRGSRHRALTTHRDRAVSGVARVHGRGGSDCVPLTSPA